MSAVLFLDANWQPLRIETWQRAIADLFLGKCEVIEHSADRTIQGVNRTYPMPSVVRVVRHFKRDRIRLKFSRLNVYARDGFRCQYCGACRPTEDLTFDHVTPRSRGGRTTWENIVACCVPCNARKANRTPAEAGMRLPARPKKPRFVPAITVRGMGAPGIPPEWRPYWTGTLEA